MIRALGLLTVGFVGGYAYSQQRGGLMRASNYTQDRAANEGLATMRQKMGEAQQSFDNTKANMKSMINKKSEDFNLDEMKDKAKDMKDKAMDKADELKKDLKGKAADLKGKADDKADDLKKGAKDLKDKAMDKAEDLKKGAKDMKDKAMDKAKDLKKDMSKDDEDKADDKSDAKEGAAGAQVHNPNQKGGFNFDRKATQKGAPEPDSRQIAVNATASQGKNNSNFDAKKTEQNVKGQKVPMDEAAGHLRDDQKAKNKDSVSMKKDQRQLDQSTSGM